MKSITVDVTLEDIVLGARLDCNSCPIARAVGRHFPEAKEIVATPSRIDVLFSEPVEILLTNYGSPIFMYRGLTPAAAYAFMVRFDMDREVSPFSFQLVLYPHDKHTPPTRTVL